MAPERAASGSGQAPQDDREERLQHHCLDLANTLFKAHYMKDVYLKCSDDVSVPVHKFVLGAQSECVPHSSPRAAPGTQHAYMHRPCMRQGRYAAVTPALSGEGRCGAVLIPHTLLRPLRKAQPPSNAEHLPRRIVLFSV